MTERDAKRLADFIGAWKRWTSRRINKLVGPGTASPATTAHRSSSPLWQPEFFDHVIRSDESYDQKWEYVRNNPVRAGLITDAEDWQFAGELTIFRR